MKTELEAAQAQNLIPKMLVLDVDEDSEVAKLLGVMQVPTLLRVTGKLVDARLIGRHSVPQVQSWEATGVSPCNNSIDGTPQTKWGTSNENNKDKPVA